MTRTTEQIQAETSAERQRLAALLADLSPQQWAAPSLCEGWRVREVVAHLTMPFRSSGLSVLAGLVRSGFSFDRYADRAARHDTATMSDEQLLDVLRSNVDHPWSPPGGGPVGALSHDVIHGLDVTEALGLPRVPAERAALVVSEARPRNLAYFGRTLDGVRLVASDADVALGDGREVDLPVAEMLLVVTGRRPVPA